jgi:hypothetical protein
MAVVATVAAACTPRDETATEEETTTPPAAMPQPTTPEGVTGGDMVVAQGQFQPTSTASGQQISGTAEVRRGGTGATGTGTSGTGTGTSGTGTGTSGTGTGTSGTGTGASGTATATGGEALELQVRIEGLTAQHAWHIHQGACSTQQAPVAVPFTEPLRATSGTPVEQTVPIPSDKLTPQQLESGQYSVRVHQSSTPGSATIACADIQRR